VLAQLGEELDSILERMPDGNIDARNLITRELNFEPGAEELQTIVRIARDREVRGARHEFPRRLLVLRLLADREIEQLRERTPLDSVWLERCADTLPQLADEARQTEADLSNTIGTDATLSPADREFLLQVGRTFSCSRERLVAAIVLAERLALVSRAAENDELETAFPAMTERDREIIRAAVRSAGEPGDGGPSRVWVDAVALHVSLRNDLDAFGEMPSWAESDDAQKAARELLIERLRRGRMACETIAARLQQQQDQAMIAGLAGSAEEIRDLGRGLFSTKLRLAAVLRDPYADPPATTDETDGVAAVRADLRQAAAAETAIESTKQITKEELFLGALKDVKRTEEEIPVAVAPGVDAEKRRRRRVWALAGVVLLLGAVSLTVNLVLLPPRPNPPEPPSVRELKPTASVSRVDSAGGMLFTHVDGWAELDRTTRSERVEKLAREAESRGFVSLWVLDEFNMPAAQWSKSGGVQLMEASETD
jgi:hypothetical protein